MTKLSIVDIDVKKITPDANQPRRYFNAAKMKTLKDSIKQLGIKQPLIVQEISKDKYLISVGERRYRAAVDLGLKDVPCIIEKPKSEVERLVQQFNVEEQHESWTPVEKAVAVANLSKHMNVGLYEVCRLLNVTESDAKRYAAFAQLVDRDAWVKSEVPMGIIHAVQSLKNVVRKISVDILEKDFTPADEKRLEHRVIKAVKAGTIVRGGDLSQLKDSFNKNPKTIAEFMTTDVSPAELFRTSKAKGALHIRRVATGAAWLSSHGRAYLGIQDVKITPEQVEIFKTAKKMLEELIHLAK